MKRLLILLLCLLAQVTQAQQVRVETLRAQATQGDAEAQYQLGLYYDANADYALAANWYENAAGQGHIQAQYNLAQLYRLGEGVQQDYEQALAWLLQAAEAGNDPLAQYMLGDIYRFGEGVVLNRFEAFRWYILAAEQTLPEAEYIVGLWLSQGIGAPEDDRAALRWLRKASEQAVPDAFFMLGTMYEAGEGIARDLQQAYVWYALAAELGNSQAVQSRDGLGSQFDGETLQNLRQKVMNCIDAAYQGCE